MDESCPAQHDAVFSAGENGQDGLKGARSARRSGFPAVADRRRHIRRPVTLLLHHVAVRAGAPRWHPSHAAHGHVQAQVTFGGIGLRRPSAKLRSVSEIDFPRLIDPTAPPELMPELRPPSTTAAAKGGGAGAAEALAASTEFHLELDLQTRYK